ncbi:MAG: NAD(P)/FAD-dependent oxidoreductase [Verrucomicrobiota bacterium]
MAHSSSSPDYDAVVIGSGPNGLAGALRLAECGWRVLVLEAAEKPGGGLRTEERTFPGFHHDVCSAVHPLAICSPWLSSLPLEKHGLEWVHPDLPVAHPLGGSEAVGHERDLDAMKEEVGESDGRTCRRWYESLLANGEGFFRDVLSPVTKVPPGHPFLMAKFGLKALQPASFLIRSQFKGTRARSLFAGHAAHSILPLEQPMTGAYAFMLGLSCHHAGWPIARGGSQTIAEAMIALLEEKQGEVVTGQRVVSIDALPSASAYLFDTSPLAMSRIVGRRFPAAYHRRLERFSYGPAAYKVDLALSEPIPWSAPECRRAGTVHVGGTMEEIARSEREAWKGRFGSKPFVLLSQPTVFDPTRAPTGRHIAWAYCHVPHGWRGNATEGILSQIERFAPGFRDTILACESMTPGDFENHNANYIGGDIVGGSQHWAQAVFRPIVKWDPYRTPDDQVFLCSSSTPPGAGVHGMCGFHAAESVLRRYGGPSRRADGTGVATRPLS